MRDTFEHPRQMNTLDAAAYLGLSHHTLNQWRYQGRGPLFVRLGRAVRYRKSDLDAYLEESLRRSTLNSSG